MMNPLFPRITVQELEQNFDFVLALVERGTSFYIEDPENGNTCMMLPVNDPVAKIVLQQDDLKTEVDDALAEMYSERTPD
jgi:hypothetical protein